MAFKFNTWDFVFVDFEASSFEADAWPIEVGLAWISDDTVHSWSSLIRPETHWKRSVWSSASAQVHGITLSELDAAPSAYEVAQVYRYRVRQHVQIAVSDAPEWEGAWEERLSETVGARSGHFFDFDQFVRSAFRGDVAAINHTLAHLEAMPIAGRAGPDAERLATAVLQGMRVTDADR